MFPNMGRWTKIRHPAVVLKYTNKRPFMFRETQIYHTRCNSFLSKRLELITSNFQTIFLIPSQEEEKKEETKKVPVKSLKCSFTYTVELSD